MNVFSFSIMTRVELVGELERLAERFWGGDGAEIAAIVRAGEVDLLLERVYCHADIVTRNNKIVEVIRLEANRADKARRLAVVRGGSAQGIDGNVADGDAAELVAEGKALFCNFKALVLDMKFRLDFAGLAFELFKMSVSGGEISFERGDFAAAKERAATLKKLAEFLDKFEEAGDCSDFHVDIIPQDKTGRRGI